MGRAWERWIGLWAIFLLVPACGGSSHHGAPGGSADAFQVTLLEPSSSASFSAPATISIRTEVSDPDATVLRVDFTANGTLIGSVESPPFDFRWKGVPDGSYVIQAIASDSRGRTAESMPVTIFVTAGGSTPPGGGEGDGDGDDDDPHGHHKHPK